MCRISSIYRIFGSCFTFSSIFARWWTLKFQFLHQGAILQALKLLLAGRLHGRKMNDGFTWDFCFTRWNLNIIWSFRFYVNFAGGVLLSRKVPLAKESVTGLWHDLFQGFHILSMGGLFVSRVVAFPDPRVFSYFFSKKLRGFAPLFPGGAFISLIIFF